MSGPLITSGAMPPGAIGPSSLGPDAPTWLLRIEDGRVSIVLQDARLPAGARLTELAIHLPHVGFPFDFRVGVSRFRHHRGSAQVVEISIEARLLLDWLHRVSGGAITGRAADDSLVLMGVAEGGARYTARARFVPEGDDGEPTLLLSLYDIRVYGNVTVPWPVLAGRILDLLPPALVSERTLTAVRLRPLRQAITTLLAGMGWKLPSLSGLVTHGVELRDGCLKARFLAPSLATREMVPLESVFDRSYRASVEDFLEDLELKRHHGQIDRLLAEDQVREALAEIYRALDGPPEPGFLAERLIGICASRAILFDEGSRVCKELLEESPNYPPALCGLASMAIGQGRPEEAAVYMERLTAAWSDGGAKEDATAADLTLAELLHES
ncbi:MAG: tetratricopeptide repeat protein, partial [Myxococcota bacterium]|nr:tetratricopeptide repeat protein [Myxococcota bacterium]